MPKLIKSWDELNGLSNDKYRIIVNKKYYNGWIVPICDEHSDDDLPCFKCNCGTSVDSKYFYDHTYLSTHTFYGSQYKASTKLLQNYGFDVEIDNWDKEIGKDDN